MKNKRCNKNLKITVIYVFVYKFVMICSIEYINFCGYPIYVSYVQRFVKLINLYNALKNLYNALNVQLPICKNKIFKKHTNIYKK